MADFEHEQLKTLFERLADRLDKTSGDEEHLAMLASLRASIAKLQTNLNRTQSGNHGQMETVLQGFIKDWQGTIEDFKSNDRTGAGAGLGKGTLLQQYAQDALQRETKGRERGARITESLNAKFREVKSSLTDFDKNLDGSAANFAALFGATGGISGKLFGAIDDNVAMYRNLRQSGESSIDSIYGMRGAAQEFHLTTKQFTDAIANGTDGARQLGAIRFGDINKRFRDATASVGRFGMSIDDTIQFQGSYMEMLRDQGNINRLDNGQIAEGMQQLVRSNNITASILGKTREETLKARAEQAKEANFETWLRGSGLSEQQQNEMRDRGAAIKSQYGDGAWRTWMQAATTGGAVTGESAEMVAYDPQLMGNIIADAVASREGNTQPLEDLVRQNQRIVNSRSNLENQMFGMLGMMDPAGAIARRNEAGMNTLKADPDKANDGTETDQAIITMGRFEETMAELHAQFQKLLDNIIKPLVDNVAPKLVGMISSATSWLAKLTESQNGLWLATGALVGGFVALKGAGMALSFLFTNVLGKGLKSLMGNLMGRGAGGIGGRLLAGAGGRAAAGGAARAGLGAVGAGLGGTAAVVGGGLLAGGTGLFVGNRMVAGNAGESLWGNREGEGGLLSSRAGGYGASAAGGALAGAAIGSVVPVLGTAIGAVIGGAGGLIAAGVQDYMSNRNRPRQTVSPDNTARSQAPAPARPAAAPPPTQEAQRRTLETINQRIANLTEAGNGYLRQIQQNNQAQLELMRAELDAARDFYAASLRLNEETNRNIRLIGSMN